MKRAESSADLAAVDQRQGGQKLQGKPLPNAMAWAIFSLMLCG
ncbi:MAG TPA: hypothetical protein VN283_06540 [Thiobacillus sp.]|nr:hypothetical protein [Thiobacillus sp.]